MLIGNAIYLAWADTKARYKRSVLGPLWLTMGNLVGVLGLSVVWGSLLHEDKSSFVPTVSLGLILWQFISGCINDGPTVFTRHANIIKNVSMPQSFFVLRVLFRQIINLAHNLIIIVGVALYYDIPLGSNVIYASFGLVLVLINLYWIMNFLGLSGARFKDVEFFIAAIIPLLFFLSPVIFRTDQLPIDLSIIWLNPLSYFIDIVRGPFLGKSPPMSNYLIVIGFFVIGSSVTWYIDRTNGKNLPFWV